MVQEMKCILKVIIFIVQKFQIIYSHGNFLETLITSHFGFIMLIFGGNKEDKKKIQKLKFKIDFDEFIKFAF